MPKKETSSSVSRKAKAVPARPAKPGPARPASKAVSAKAVPVKAVAVKAAVSVGKKAEAARKPAPPAKAAPARAAAKAAAPARKASPAAKPASASAKTAKPAAKVSVPAKPAAGKAVPVKPAAKPVAKAPAPKAAAAQSGPSKPATVKAVPAKAPARPVPVEEPVLVKVRPAGNDLSAKIIHMIAEEMAVEEAELTPSASFREDLNLDEIDVAELLVRAEELFNLKQEFDDEEWENCQTVGDFIALVERRVGGNSRRAGAAPSNSGKKSSR